MHWDGVGWTVSPVPGLGASTTLTSISARSASDIWAVGSTDDGTGVQTVILHWTGSSWHRKLSPNPAGAAGSNVPSGVTATSAGNAWAVGTFSNGTVGRTLILHWNGRTWARVASPNPGGSGSTFLFGLA